MAGIQTNYPLLLRFFRQPFRMDTKELIKQCRSIRLSEEEEGKVVFKSRMKIKGKKDFDWLPGKESSSFKRSQDREVETSNTASMENRAKSKN